jgi:hypothetical protein
LETTAAEAAEAQEYLTALDKLVEKAMINK